MKTNIKEFIGLIDEEGVIRLASCRLGTTGNMKALFELLKVAMLGRARCGKRSADLGTKEFWNPNYPEL